MMGEEVEGFEARSMITIRAGNADGRAGRFKRDPTSFDAALTRWDSTHRPRRAQRLTQPVRPRYLIVGEKHKRRDGSHFLAPPPDQNSEGGGDQLRYLPLRWNLPPCGIAQ